MTPCNEVKDIPHLLMGDEPTEIGQRKLEPAYNDAGALPLNRFNDTFQIFKCDAFSIEGARPIISVLPGV